MDSPPNRIAEQRKKRKLTQQELADAIGAHWVTVSKLERGELPLTLEWSEKIADALRVEEGALRLERAPRARIYIEGVIDEGRAKGFGISDEPLPLNLVTGVGETGGAIWSIVADASLYPFFQAGDILRLVVQVDDPLKYTGRLCLVRATTDSKQHIGFLERGDNPSLFTIRRISGPAIVNISIEYMAVVERAIYQPKLPKELKAEIGSKS